MTDLSKVNTSLLPTVNNSEAVAASGNSARTYTKSPESDRPVMYNTNGFLETVLPPLRGGFVTITDITTEDEARKASQLACCLRGTYFHSDNLTLPPCLVGPNVTHLINEGPTGNYVWKWPNISVLCKYLREAFPGMYRPGLCWDIMVTHNDRSTGNHQLQLEMPTPAFGGQVIKTIGYNRNAEGVHQLYGGGAYPLPIPTVTIRTVISKTTPAEERLDVFILNQ